VPTIWWIGLLLTSFAIQASENLVQNGDASERTAFWTRSLRPGQAATEIVDGRPCFVLRNGGALEQRLRLPPDPAGKYLLIIGTGASQRVLPGGDITDLPSLWARVHPDPAPSNRTVFQNMLFRPHAPGDWVSVHGIFPIPAGVDTVQLRLGQARRSDTPHDGSAAYITNVEVRLFETREDAAAYAATYVAKKLK
jgi:hypothetical protein